MERSFKKTPIKKNYNYTEPKGLGKTADKKQIHTVGLETQTTNDKSEAVFRVPPSRKRDPTVLSEPNLSEIESLGRFSPDKTLSTIVNYVEIDVSLKKRLQPSKDPSKGPSKDSLPKKSPFAFESSASEVPDERLHKLGQKVKREEQKRRELYLQSMQELGEQIDEIHPRLFITNYRSASNFRRLSDKEITHILVCGPSLEQHFPHVIYLSKCFFLLFCRTSNFIETS